MKWIKKNLSPLSKIHFIIGNSLLSHSPKEDTATTTIDGQGNKRRRRVSDNLLNYELSGGKLSFSQIYSEQKKASGDSIFTKHSFNGDFMEECKKIEESPTCRRYEDLLNPQLKIDYSLDLNHLEVIFIKNEIYA